MCSSRVISFSLHLLMFALLDSSFHCHSWSYKFFVKEASYERLCDSKDILVVNGQFPGPTIYAHKGEIVVVEVHNQGKENISIHWHGVEQPRNPWWDGPGYITQCPIQPGHKFIQKLIFSEEEGTLWWHAHTDWSRATVHGAIIVYPRPGTIYPFPKPYAEKLIILGEWWKEDIKTVLEDFLESGGQPMDSDAYLINGQPGDFYPCSEQGTYELNVIYGKTYLLRIINAAMNEMLYLGIANHKLTVVGTDASYTKPLTRDFITIGPGQTYDCILHADQNHTSGHNYSYYYMAASPYVSGSAINFDNSTTTARLKYEGRSPAPNVSSPLLPHLPACNDTPPAINFTGSLRSLASKEHPIHVPLKVKTHLFTTVSVNTFPCHNKSNAGCSTCEGINGTRFAASMNNISFVKPPSVDILEAYYYGIKGVYGKNFPRFPPYVFNYTAEYQPLTLLEPKRGTEVRILEYGSSIEMVIQGTSLVSAIDHPMHLHGFSFYVVGQGLGNFNKTSDPKNYNLVDPPRRNTIPVPRNGWVAIRFSANNPGVWYMHCHLERHLSWGMNTVFIVKDGKRPEEQIMPPPPDMPPC